MTGPEIACISIAGAGLLLIVMSLFFFAHGKRIKRSCTASVTGKVVTYRYAGHDSGRTVAPVVEYEVNGMLYRAYRRYKGVVRTHRNSADKSECEVFVSERDVLHINCVGMSVSIREAVENKWPLGSDMTVFYDPDAPKRGFVEKVVVLSTVAGIVLLCVGLGMMALAGLFYLIF